ncbi:hypothetical protein GCM10007877_10210 [Marinibactrum halimedae]|uniref:Uncharacterized protein n=1 Tax=Marinibactrum halimedae TaxID=1444977 RepID=A0AA37T5Q1_9GAMM|nr:hypothetical protein GCM10007877_10210 [Marinibactrum halimedae]
MPSTVTSSNNQEVLSEAWLKEEKFKEERLKVTTLAAPKEKCERHSGYLCVMKSLKKEYICM